MQSAIYPKNILMVGPTGCGKSELARSLAQLSNAPYIKVEATQYTEIGYHGKDVDTIISELVSRTLRKTAQRIPEISKGLSKEVTIE